MEKKKSSYLQKANKKDMLKSIMFSFNYTSISFKFEKKVVGVSLQHFQATLEHGRERFSSQNLTIQRITLGANFETNLYMTCLYQ